MWIIWPLEEIYWQSWDVCWLLASIAAIVAATFAILRAAERKIHSFKQWKWHPKNFPDNIFVCLYWSGKKNPEWWVISIFLQCHIWLSFIFPIRHSLTCTFRSHAAHHQFKLNTNRNAKWAIDTWIRCIIWANSARHAGGPSKSTLRYRV